MPSHCIPDRTAFTMYRYDICLTLLFLHLLIIWLRYTSRGLACLIFTDAILCGHIRESSERDSSPDRIGIHRTPLSSIVIGQWEEPKQLRHAGDEPHHQPEKANAGWHKPGEAAGRAG